MNGHGNEKYSANGTSVPKKTLLTVLCILMLKATAVAHVSTVAAPQDIRFDSYNLQNVLKWKPGNGAGDGTRYTVQYAIYGDEEENKGIVVWRTKAQCKDVLQTFCDLSNETSDLEDEYYGRVKAISAAGTSKWTTTSRFSPKRQTTFGPPILKVTVNGRKLIIKLKGPMRWKIKNNTKEHSLAKYYPQMMYNVSVHNNMTKKTMIFLLHNNSLEYGLLTYNTEFCVSARVLFLSLIYQSNGSRIQCVTTTKDPFSDWILLVMLGCILPIVLTLFFLTLIGCLLYHYIFGNKQRTPSNLWVKHQPDTKLLLTVNHFNVSLAKTSFGEGQRGADCHPEPSFSVLKEPDEGKQPVVRILGYATQACAPPLRPQMESAGEDSDSDGEGEGESDAHRSRSPAWRSLSQGSDYGVVVKAASLAEKEEEDGEGRAEGRGGADVDVPPSARESGGQLEPGADARWASYRRQFQAAGRQEEEEEEEEEEEVEDADMGGSILVDWDPNIGKLRVPNLSFLQMEPDQVEEERPECDRVVPTDILSSVYIRQSSEDSTVSMDTLTKMEKNWALQISMGK